MGFFLIADPIWLALLVLLFLVLPWVGQQAARAWVGIAIPYWMWLAAGVLILILSTRLLHFFREKIRLPTFYNDPRRHEVWLALSEFFLDTEVSLDFVISKLRSTGFSCEQIEHIFRYEVAPACVQNFYSAAGEWGGFDEAWLKGAIGSHLRLAWLLRWVPGWNFLRSRSATMTVKGDFRKLMTRMRNEGFASR